MINSHLVQAHQVANLFHSVQLNVNNPHFLIMPGRITKVINMKPPEILGIIEEAAGTRMYETKKEQSIIVKKQAKVDEINRILAEDITPTLEKLSQERANYLRWSSLNNEVRTFRGQHIRQSLGKDKGSDVPGAITRKFLKRRC